MATPIPTFTANDERGAHDIALQLNILRAGQGEAVLREYRAVNRIPHIMAELNRLNQKFKECTTGRRDQGIIWSQITAIQLQMAHTYNRPTILVNGKYEIAGMGATPPSSPNGPFLVPLGSRAELSGLLAFRGEDLRTMHPHFPL
jgi:hypothetical protein